MERKCIAGEDIVLQSSQVHRNYVVDFLKYGISLHLTGQAVKVAPYVHNLVRASSKKAHVVRDARNAQV